jgi:hypothetical protein
VTFDREITFLKALHDDLTDTFGPDLATPLFGAAAAEFFAGPEGVARMFQQHTPAGKPIADKKMPR